MSMGCPEQRRYQDGCRRTRRPSPKVSTKRQTDRRAEGDPIRGKEKRRSSPEATTCAFSILETINLGSPPWPGFRFANNERAAERLLDSLPTSQFFNTI